MKCPKCGTAFAATKKFCGVCGTKMESTTEVNNVAPPPVPQATKPAHRAKNRKKLIKVVVALAILIVVIVVAVNIFMPSQYEQIWGEIFIMQGEDGIIVQPHGRGRITIDGVLVTQQRNFDGTIAMLLVSHDGNNNRNTLYIVEDRVTFISNDVHSARFSHSGEGVAFVRDVVGSFGELVHFRDGRTTVLEREFTIWNNIVLSPDGRIVGYTLIDENNNIAGYFHDGRRRELGRGISPSAISNNARYVYFKRDGTLFVQRGDNADTRENLGSDAFIIAFNRDLSQAIYSRDGRTFISRNGGRGSALSDLAVEFLLPRGTVHTGMIIGVSSFANTFYRDSENNIRLINNRFEVSGTIARNITSAHLASDGRTITYQRGDRIYRINGLADNAESLALVNENVSTFLATDDGGSVFFLNTDRGLFYQRGSRQPVIVDDFIVLGTIPGVFFSLHQGRTLFYVNDGELFVSNGGRGSVVRGFEGDISFAGASLFAISVQSSDSIYRFTYRSTDGKNFQLMTTTPIN